MLPDPDLPLVLIRDGLITSEQDWLPLPGGQTNQLWRVGGIVVKRYVSQNANPRFPNDPVREAAMLRHLAGQGLAPELIKCVALNGSDYLLYTHLEGHSWRQDTAPVGAMLRRVHSVPPLEGVRQLVGGSLAIEHQVENMLPSLPESMVTEMQIKRPSTEIPPADTKVLLHADVVPGNIVVTDEGVRLIDWQCPAFGDPAEDLAVFLSPAMQKIYRGRPLSDDEIDAFLMSYGDEAVVSRLQALRPWHHWAMAAYCGWKAARGAHQYREAMQLELDALQ